PPAETVPEPHKREAAGKKEQPETPAPTTQAAKAPAEEPKPAEPEKPKPSEQATSGPAPADVGGKIFLQVAAVGRSEAEVLVEALKKKGFPALVGPGHNDTIFRVLVGP